MDVILVHIGEELPVYINDCVKQLKLFGNNDTILVSNKINERFIGCGELKGVNFLSIEQLDNNDKIKRYNELKFFNKSGNFWDFTCKRLFYVELAMEYLQLKKAWHIENDNLVYCDLSVQQKLNPYPVLITQITQTLSGAGIVLINELNALKTTTDQILEVMDLGFSGFREVYGDEFISEMRILNVLANRLDSNIYYLPLTTFDCASWGQLLDGIPSQPGQPCISPNHIIAKHLLTLPESERKITWTFDDEGRKIPMFKNNKLNNLHIHSKRLNLWLSK